LDDWDMLDNDHNHGDNLFQGEKKMAKEKSKLKGFNIKRDLFRLSDGNLKVLETIPKMMKDYKWRKRLRLIVLDYIVENQLKRDWESI
jgi:hypothetical protein